MGLKDLGIFFGVFVAWIVLSRWVLPWFGVPTCTSGSCQVDRPAVRETAPQPTEGQDALRADGTQEPDDPDWNDRPTPQEVSPQPQNR